MISLLLGAQLSPPLPRRQPGWSLKVRYPRFTAGGKPAKQANAAAKTQEREAFDRFLAWAQRASPGVKNGAPGARYEMRGTPHRIADRPNLASGYVEIVTRLAGANGKTTYATLNFGPEGELGLADLFTDPRSAIFASSTALFDTMKAMKNPPPKVASGEWTRLTDAQADRFVVGRSGILFLFDQGELSTAAPKVIVPWSRLQGVAPWVRKAVGVGTQ